MKKEEEMDYQRLSYMVGVTVCLSAIVMCDMLLLTLIKKAVCVLTCAHSLFSGELHVYHLKALMCVYSICPIVNHDSSYLGMARYFNVQGN